VPVPEPPRRSVPAAAGVRVRARPVVRPWQVFAGIAAVLGAVIIGGVAGADDPGGPVAGQRITFAPPAYPFPARSTGILGIPGVALSNLDLLTPYPLASLTPRIPLCILTDLEVGPGINKQSPRVKAAVEATGDLTCSLSSGSVGDALVTRAGSTPGATQRGRVAKLAAKGPFGSATIVGVRTGPNGKPQANVVFEPMAAGSSGCWRSRLSLTEDDDGYGVGSIEAPVEVACR
jgi:hypothetical protein